MVPADRLLQGSDTKNSHVVYGQDVEIFASRASCTSQPTTGSSKVHWLPWHQCFGFMADFSVH